ncbi:MAG: hypothetical protein ACR2PA_19710, partial [Hyphomicrobiaceae bacterium]
MYRWVPQGRCAWLRRKTVPLARLTRLAFAALALMIGTILATAAQAQITFTFEEAFDGSGVILTFSGSSQATSDFKPDRWPEGHICIEACLWDFLDDALTDDFDTATIVGQAPSCWVNDGEPLPVDLEEDKVTIDAESVTDNVTFDFDPNSEDDTDVHLTFVTGDTVSCQGAVKFDPADLSIDDITIPAGGVTRTEIHSAAGGLSFRFVKGTADVTRPRAEITVPADASGPFEVTIAFDERVFDKDDISKDWDGKRGIRLLNGKLVPGSFSRQGMVGEEDIYKFTVEPDDDLNHGE